MCWSVSLFVSDVYIGYNSVSTNQIGVGRIKAVVMIMGRIIVVKAWIYVCLHYTYLKEYNIKLWIAASNEK